MTKELKRIRLEPDTDLLQILEEVHADKVPRLIEKEGEALAVVLDPEDYRDVVKVPTSKRRKKELLSLAGIWSDLDAEQMIEDLYTARHEAPPSPSKGL